MIETGALPGLEGAVDEFGLELDEPDEADELAAIGRSDPAAEEDV